MSEFQEKLRSIQFGSVPGGTRSGQARTDRINQTEKEWDTDFDAYRRLRRDGLQPKNSAGSAQMEKRANTKWEIEQGVLTSKPVADRIESVQAEAATVDVGI
jgi:hypothetical protein